MADLVPIKVRICIGPDGKHKHPPFNQLDPAIRGHMDWSHFFDVHGLGWHYDQVSGLGESDLNDPDVDNSSEHANPDPACWYGANCLPKPFVDAAVATFPDDVVTLSEASWETFYDERAHVYEDDEVLDADTLVAIDARIRLEESGHAPAPSQAIVRLRADALNPAKKKRGICTNPRRYWVLLKASRGIVIHADYTYD